MELTCGPECWCPDEVHAEPEIDWVGDMPLAHGESERAVPGSGFDYGSFRGGPDMYCLCGHPNYMTCPRWMTEGLTSWEVNATSETDDRL